MITVLYAGNPANKDCSHFLFKHLAQSFNTSYISENNFWQEGQGDELLLYETGQILDCRMKPCIVIVPPGSTAELGKNFDSDTLFILSSEQKKILRTMVKLNLRTMTCGASAKDSLTFSSKDDDELVVSLQRSVVNFRGETIEPLEFPIKRTPEIDDFTAMAYISILIETGIIDKN